MFQQSDAWLAREYTRQVPNLTYKEAKRGIAAARILKASLQARGLKWGIAVLSTFEYSLRERARAAINLHQKLTGSDLRAFTRELDHLDQAEDAERLRWSHNPQPFRPWHPPLRHARVLTPKFSQPGRKPRA